GARRLRTRLPEAPRRHWRSARGRPCRGFPLVDLVEIAGIPLPEWLAPAVQRRLERYDAERIGERMWAKDHTIWKDDPAEITNRLGWLWAPEHYHAEVEQLNAFAAEVAAEGYESIVVLGMGGSSLAPEVFHAVTGPV